jgi:hypothetical protein
MSKFTEADANVARELAGVSLRALTVNGNVHPGSVIAATARMAGTYLFRSLRLEIDRLQPGAPVLSHAANTEVPRLIRIAGAIVTASGLALDDTKAALPVEQKHQPRQPFLETQRLLEPGFRAVTGRAGLTDEDGARASAVATGMLVARCAKVLEPNEAFRIAVYGFIEGAKTAPDPIRL